MVDNTDIANMITNGTGDSNVTQWIASRAVRCGGSYASFGVRIVYLGNVSNYYLYYSYGNSDSPSLAIRPVVSLEPKIQLEGSSDAGWTIK